MSELTPSSKFNSSSDHEANNFGYQDEVYHLEKALLQERGNCLRSSMFIKLSEDTKLRQGVNWASYASLTTDENQTEQNIRKVLLIALPCSLKTNEQPDIKYNMRLITNEIYLNDARQFDQILSYDFTLTPDNQAQYAIGAVSRQDLSNTNYLIFCFDHRGQPQFKPGLRLTTALQCLVEPITNQPIFPFGTTESTSDCIDSIEVAQTIMDSIKDLSPRHKSA